MSTTEIKEKLIAKIQSISNQELLIEATRLLEIQLDEIETPYKLTPELSNLVGESQAQITKGEFKNHEEANKEIEQWFEK